VDCIALIDDATVESAEGPGRHLIDRDLSSALHTRWWSGAGALGGVPIHLHAADHQWVMRADPAVQFWEGDTKQLGRASRWFGWRTLRRRHRPPLGGLERRPRRTTLGDILQVVRAGTSALCGRTEPDPALRRQGSAHGEVLEPFAFDAIYGAFSGRGR